MDGETGVGHPAEGIEHLCVRPCALFGEDAAVVDIWEPGDIPGVGGVPGPALAA